MTELLKKAVANGWVKYPPPTEGKRKRHREVNRLVMQRKRAERRGQDTSHLPPRQRNIGTPLDRLKKAAELKRKITFTWEGAAKLLKMLCG